MNTRRNLLALLYGALALYLIVPILVMAVMGLKDAPFIGLPIRAWTFDWYRQALADREVLAAFLYSLGIALATTAIALPVGVWSALALARRDLKGRAALFALVCLPMIIPSIVNAISLRIYAQAAGVPTGALAVTLGLAAHNVPFVVLMVLTRLSAMPRNLVEAARDLGADELIAFLRVTVPFLAPALIAGAGFSMLIAFDDFVRSIFLAGYQPTLPVLLYAKLTTGVSPFIAAVATLIVFVSLAFGFLSERFARRQEVRS